MTAEQLFSILNLMTMAAWLPPMFIVPALVLTFLLGPAGLLLYLTIRWFFGRCVRLQADHSRSG